MGSSAEIIAEDGNLMITPEFINNMISTIIPNKKRDVPFLICNLDQILHKFSEWKILFPRITPFYAVKCNDDEMVLKTLAALGSGFDCSSEVCKTEELAKIIQLGVAPSRIIFANPIKMLSHIAAAKALGVTVTTFDNISELHKLHKKFPETKVLIRLRWDDITAMYILGEKFGAPLKSVPGLLMEAKKLGLDVIGVAFHVGTAFQDKDVVARGIEMCAEVFKTAKAVGFNFTTLDIGGGFPGSDSLFFAKIAEAVRSSLDKYFPRGCGVNIIAEPGRFFVCTGFTLVTRIHSIREEDFEQEDIVKAGIGSIHIMYYINDGVHGCFSGALFGVEFKPNLVTTAMESEPRYSSTIWGPTMNGLDKVCTNIVLPKLNIEDYIYFNNMGAYTSTLATTFNGLPKPCIYYYSKRLSKEGFLQQANQMDFIENLKNLNRQIGFI